MENGSGTDPAQEKRRTCVLEDSTYFLHVNSVTIEEIKQQAMNRVQWRSLIHQNKEFLCGAGHSNDLEETSPSASKNMRNCPENCCYE